MKIITAIVLALAVSFLSILPAYYIAAEVKEERLLGVTAGEIWNKRDSFHIDQVHVKEGRIEVVIYEMTRQSEEEIQTLAAPYEVLLDNRTFEGRDSIMFSKNFTFTEDKTDVVCEGKECSGLIFPMKNAPYVSKGLLMVPLREVITMLEESSDSNYEIRWMGGEAGIIELITNSGILQISCKNSTQTRLPQNETYILDGKIEVQEGVAYFPCSRANFAYIVPMLKMTQDFEEMSIQLFS